MTKKMTMKVVSMPVNDIALTYANGRSGVWDTIGANADAETSFEAFTLNLLVEGQKVAVIGRPSKKGKQPCELIVGFRRVAALSAIQENPAWLQKAIADAKVEVFKYEPGKPVNVMVDVQELSDLEARKLNGLENIGRENLSAPDQAWLINDLYNLHLVAKQELTGAQLAAEFGMSQAYAGRLLKIMQNIKPAITKHWREKASVALTTQEMLVIADLKPGEQQAAYESAMKKAEKKESNPRGPSAWVETAKKQAENAGKLLGTLEKLEQIQLTGLVFDNLLIENFSKAGIVKIGKKGATQRAMGQIARACEKGYETAVNAAVEEEEKEAAE